MSDQWFVRVEEKEYGPVDLATLLDWKADGRLIPENPVRRGDRDWQPAAEVPELFPAPPPLPSAEEQLYRARTFGEIIAETCRLYARGFFQFIALALLISVPSLGFKIAFAYVNYAPDGTMTASSRMAAAIAIVLLAVILSSWPIYVAGLQFATHEVALGRKSRLRDILRRAVNFWPRIARLSLFVYGSFIFWTALPFLMVLSLLGSASFLAIFISLLALVAQVYMFGRLFINFMFWQQTATLGGLDGVEALQQSKELARSGRERPAMERPLWRGALLASIWLLLLLGVSAIVELPFVIARLHGIGNFEDAVAIMKQVMNAPAPDAIMLASYVLSSLVHAILRPLLGIAFVVLYFDAKRR